MCGFAGFIDFRHGSHRAVLEKMTQTLWHRGPDGEGLFFEQLDHYQIGLGHRRLAILDLSEAGKQPYTFGDWTLVYNGEIYNFQEIKISLQQAGYRFESSGDTEVFIKAFDCWGMAALDKCIGMFAFALYNRRTQQLYLGSDRAATKPLYYYYHQGILLFGSELKALLAHPSFVKTIDRQGVAAFFRYGYIPAPLSIFQYVQKNPVGHLVCFDCRQRKLTQLRYWNKFQSDTLLPYNEAQLLENLATLLTSACAYRMVSDVPVGIFLSGGYDSTWVAYQVAQGNFPSTKTFTIGFDDLQYDESAFASRVARRLGLPHYTYTCTLSDALAIVPQLPIIYDEPLGDSSAIPCVLLSQWASKHVKVVLSADGGDEVFGGYARYVKACKTKDYLQKIPTALRLQLVERLLGRNFSPKVQKFIACAASDLQLLSLMKIQSQYYHEILTQQTSQAEAQRYLSDEPSASDPINAMLAWDYQHYLPNDIMAKVDRACMYAGIEAREPLLDHRLVELMASVQGNVKIRDGTTKYLFKKIVHQAMPATMMQRPKKGFSIPLARWLGDKAFRTILHDNLHQASLETSGLLDPKVCQQYLKDFLAGKTAYSTAVWHILQFQLWYKHWIDR